MSKGAVRDVPVSFEVEHSTTHGQYLNETLTELMEEMALDVARDEGVAGAKTSLRWRVQFMIENQCKYLECWLKKHKEPDLLESFHIHGDGQQSLR